jgi:hypothetical protein
LSRGYSLSPLLALIYSFLFGLLHGILPDEHTWPITFSYAIGGASGKEGMKAGLFFSAAFTMQRTLLSELSYLALAPFLLNTSINGFVYIIVGLAMSIAGAIVIRRNRYVHLHLLGHHHADDQEMETSSHVFAKDHAEPVHDQPASTPIRWTLIHGFIAGFGIGGFSLFINTVAAPAMPGPWAGFLPGLLFGLGTTLMLVLIGTLFGASLRWTRKLTEAEVKKIGAQTGGRTLFFGGGLFIIAGVLTLFGLDRSLPIDAGYALIGLFMLIVAVPAFIYSWREVVRSRELPHGTPTGGPSRN